jgi:very-short-patch-repair endonuclease
MTDAEKQLWERLRKKSLGGLRFRRQHPIGPYIADFFCNEVGLVVEVDGGIHHAKEQELKDRLRNFAMKKHGLAVIRFSNEQIANDIDDVLARIKAAIEARIHPPPKSNPQSGEGRGGG